MKKTITAVLATALLTGCGSAANGRFDPDDEFKQECLANGGTYTEFEQETDSCTYNQGQQ